MLNVNVSHCTAISLAEWSRCRPLSTIVCWQLLTLFIVCHTDTCQLLHGPFLRYGVQWTKWVCSCSPCQTALLLTQLMSIIVVRRRAMWHGLHIAERVVQQLTCLCDKRQTVYAAANRQWAVSQHHLSNWWDGWSWWSESRKFFWIQHPTSGTGLPFPGWMWTPSLPFPGWMWTPI